MLVFVSGCAANFSTQYPEVDTEEETGTLVIRFSDPMPNVHVAIDGKLLAEDKYTERIEIKSVPSRPLTLSVVASSSSRESSIDLKKTINIPPGGEHVELISSPPQSTGFWIYQGLYFIGVFAYVAVLTDYHNHHR
jgi:hypothetical protein